MRPIYDRGIKVHRAFPAVNDVTPGDETPGNVTPSTSGEVVVDARGLRCPQPVIELAKAAKAGASVVVLLADDPVADIDVAAWCLMTRNILENKTPLPGSPDSGVSYRVVIAGG